MARYGRAITRPVNIVRNETPVAAGTLTPITLSASATLTPILVREPLKTLAVTEITTSTIVKDRFWKLPNILTAAGSLTRTLFHPVVLGSTLTSAMTFNRVKLLSLNSPVVMISSLSKVPSKLLAATVTLTPTLTKKAVHYITLACSIITTSAIVRVAVHYIALALSVTVTSLISLRRTVLRALAASLSIGGSLLRKLFKTFATPITMSPTLNRGLTIKMVASVISNLSLTPAKAKFLTIAAGLVSGPSLTKKLSAARTLAASLVTTAQIVKLDKKYISASINFNAATSKFMARRLDAQIIIGPALSKRASLTKRLDASITLVTSLSFIVTSIDHLKLLWSGKPRFPTTGTTIRGSHRNIEHGSEHGDVMRSSTKGRVE